MQKFWKPYKRLFIEYTSKENSTFIYIQKVKLNPNNIKLSDDFTAKTAIERSKQMIKKVLKYCLLLIQ